MRFVVDIAEVLNSFGWNLDENDKVMHLEIQQSNEFQGFSAPGLSQLYLRGEK